jgi:diguanylate cyclase (GGDEF)-like protein
VARDFKAHCRQYDYVARAGEDRFALILPGMGREESITKASSLEAIVTSAAIRSGADGLVSLALGAAFYPDDADTAKSLLEIAERRTRQYMNRQISELEHLAARTHSQSARIKTPA